MLVPTRLVLMGIFVGSVSGLAVAQMSPGPTLAAVVSKPPVNYGKALDTHLAKFNGDYFAIGTEPGIELTSNDPAVIRKIGFGETRFVTVDTTASGVYSSDGLTSPHVRYPGVFTQRLRLHFMPFSGEMFGWSRLTGWVNIPMHSANSIGFLDTDRLPSSQQGVCVSDTDIGGCR